MRKILTVLMCVFGLVGLTACSSVSPPKTPKATTTPSVSAKSKLGKKKNGDAKPISPAKYLSADEQKKLKGLMPTDLNSFKSIGIDEEVWASSKTLPSLPSRAVGVVEDRVRLAWGTISDNKGLDEARSTTCGLPMKAIATNPEEVFGPKISRFVSISACEWGAKPEAYKKDKGKDHTPELFDILPFLKTPLGDENCPTAIDKSYKYLGVIGVLIAPTDNKNLDVEEHAGVLVQTAWDNGRTRISIAQRFIGNWDGEKWLLDFPDGLKADDLITVCSKK